MPWTQREPFPVVSFPQLVFDRPSSGLTIQAISGIAGSTQPKPATT
jgi:hypothetical protein